MVTKLGIENTERFSAETEIPKIREIQPKIPPC